MSERDDGGPAFPQVETSDYKGGMGLDWDVHSVGGMSMRDWFAGMALQGMLASGDVHMNIASHAYQYADAMLAERNK